VVQAPTALEARLRKLVWNVPFNGLCTALGGTTRDISDHPASRTAALGLMDEVIGAAAASGVRIEPGFAQAMLATTDAMEGYNPSMRLDYLAGRPLEVDAIYRQVIAYAGSRGYAMRATGLLADQLDYLASHRG
jgi:2-dehydropantoate 2-reductase